MSNNLTRKSLAFGALVALASSVIAGAPAQAAGEVIVAPVAGTSYTTFSTEAFTVATSFAPGYTPASYAQLKYEVATAGVIQTSVAVGADTAAAKAALPALADLALTSGKAVVAAGSTAATDVRLLKVALKTPVAATTATTTVTVTAFVDANNDGALTAGEWSSAQTITFKKYSEVTPTVTLTTPAAGDVAVKATATLGDINVEQLGYTASVKGGVDVAFTTTANPTGITTTLATSRFTSSAVTALVATDVVTAQAKFGSTLLGTAVSATVAARTIATVVGALVEGPNAKVLTGPTARLNTSHDVKATVKAAAVGSADPLPVAGVAVTAAVSAFGTLSTTRKLSINGTVYTANADVPASIALTSDANGEVKVTLLSTGFADADAVTVTFASQNITATAVTVTQKATAYTISADNGNLYSSPLGTSKAVALSVKDQFGTLSAETADRLAVTPALVSGLTSWVTPGVSYLPVVGGKATYTAASGAGTVAGQLSLSVALQSLDTATQNYVAASPAVAAFTAVRVNFTTAADSFTTAPAATATAKVTADAFTDAIADTTDNATYTVVVANEGTALTIAAPGAYIKAVAGTTTYGADSLTLNTPTGGSVAVTVYAHTVGSLTVTFTNGVAVKTSVVTVTTDLAPALVSLVTPAQAQVGQALDVVINVTDKWGNAVATPAYVANANAGALLVSSTGTGYFASSAPVANAAGKATVKYIVGTADIGTAYLSATLDLATDVTAAKSIEFGLTDGDVVAGGRRVFVNAEFAKGRTVTVTIDGKRIYSKVQTTDNAVELAFTQKKKGSHTVTVRISGGIVFTEKVTTN